MRLRFAVNYNLQPKGDLLVAVTYFPLRPNKNTDCPHKYGSQSAQGDKTIVLRNRKHHFSPISGRDAILCFSDCLEGQTRDRDLDSSLEFTRSSHSKLFLNFRNFSRRCPRKDWFRRREYVIREKVCCAGCRRRPFPTQIHH